MDKTPEINSSPENPKIPENWKFPERNEGIALRAFQVDKDEGYLALDMSSHGRGTIDYFFSRDGSPLLERNIANLPRIQIYKWGELQIEYFFTYGQTPYMNVSFSKLDDPDAQPKSVRDFLIPSNVLGFTERGIIDKVLMQSPKLEGPDPDIEFSGFQDKQVRYDVLRLHGLKILDQEQPNKLVLINRQGKKEYVVLGDTVIEEDREGKKVPFFVVTQSHFDAANEEARKILRGPTQIDMEEVRLSLLSKPPYPRDEKGKLDVPWRDIGQLVGASLSYSYPPPTPGK